MMLINDADSYPADNILEGLRQYLPNCMLHGQFKELL